MQGVTPDVDVVLPAVPPPMGLSRYMTLVGWGLLVTTLGQVMSIGLYPVHFLLKDQLHLPASAMSNWFLWAVLPWSFKPIAGSITDALPPRSRRRRYYLPLATTAAGFLWLAMNMVPRTFDALLVAVGCGCVSWCTWRSSSPRLRRWPIWGTCRGRRR